jgi:hypothetical protein
MQFPWGERKLDEATVSELRNVIAGVLMGYDYNSNPEYQAMSKVKQGQFKALVQGYNAGILTLIAALEGQGPVITEEFVQSELCFAAHQVKEVGV